MALVSCSLTPRGGSKRGGAELLVLCTNTMHKVAGADHRSTTDPLPAHR